MNEALYLQYGKRMMEGWHVFSKGVRLIVVFKGQVLSDLKQFKTDLITIQKL
jgi:hypothetical protein